MFVDVVADGDRGQCLFERGRGDVELATAGLDVGDLVWIGGRRGESGTGWPSILVDDWRLVAKSLHHIAFDRPAKRLPRALDLIVHPRHLELLRQRSAVVASLRGELGARGFTEVETPILATTHGGASARPFRTSINAYDMDLYLRIAPELNLKRLVVAGMGPVFEVSRNFRNEGVDATHNPEFTSLEAYQPGADYVVMKDLTQALIQAAATAICGRPAILRDGLLIDIGGQWPMVDVCDAVSAAVGERVDVDMDIDACLAIAARHGIRVGPRQGVGAMIEELYGELVEPTTVEPTFYCDFPVETSPLAGPHRSKPGRAERWDLVINGMELGTAYSELTDPAEQRLRLTEQSFLAAAGDAEAMEVDEDFLHALEIGMPSTGGLGIGVDRLVMLLTDTAIRDVLTFPFTKPRPTAPAADADPSARAWIERP